MKVAILGAANFNEVDGSTIWMLNLCKLMAGIAGLQVTFVSAHPLRGAVLLADMPPAVRVLDPDTLAAHTGRPVPCLDPGTVAAVLRDWEYLDGRFDRYLIRGEQFLTELLADPDFRARVVAYSPGLDPDLAQPVPEWLDTARKARTPLIVQSMAAKQLLEAIFDYPAPIVHVLPPVVFDMSPTDAAPRDPAHTVLCYSGKIDVAYGLDWLLDLARGLAGAPGIKISLIAGKDAWRDRAPAFFADMDQFRADVAAGRLPHVAVVTNLAHGHARARMAQADFAWCLRHSRYDDVLEISTKVVEFCAAGVVPILNDTALNRDLFGPDYPYLVDPARDMGAQVTQFLHSKGSAQHQLARARIAHVAEQFSATRLAPALEMALQGRARRAGPLVHAARHILLATHNPKFLHLFLDQVRADRLVRVTHQPWVNMAKPASPPVVPDDVDTVFCEWACENAVWHSHNKRAGTKLIVRLHRFELFEEFPRRIHWPAVDALIVVSAHIRDVVVQRFGLDPARVHVWPQFIDWPQLRRAKLPQAAFTVGMVGITPFGHKRFDRAIDFFAGLRARDPRFSMVVRGVMPWQIAPLWQDRTEDRARFVDVFRHVQTDPVLAGAVRFDPPGPDMEEWYRGVGVILSASDSEGCHTAVMEGIASGCYPVVHDWPGAQTLFAPHVHADLHAAIADVIAFADLPQPLALAQREALSQTMKAHDVTAFTRQFFAL